MDDFLEKYLQAPSAVKSFFYSDEFNYYLNDYQKKVEIDEHQTTDLVYLLQDLIFKLFEPKSIMELKDYVKDKLKLEEEKANILAYQIFNSLLPKINKLWQEGIKLEEQLFINPEQEKLIKKIEEIKQKTKPTKILNLQKIIPPKKEEAKIKTVINLAQEQKPNKEIIKVQIPQISTESLETKKNEILTDKIEINIPKVSSEGLKTQSWSEKDQEKLETSLPKEKNEDSQVKTNVVIIKKSPENKKNEEGIIDLSNY